MTKRNSDNGKEAILIFGILVLLLGCFLYCNQKTKPLGTIYLAFAPNAVGLFFQEKIEKTKYLKAIKWGSIATIAVISALYFWSITQNVILECLFLILLGLNISILFVAFSVKDESNNKEF